MKGSISMEKPKKPQQDKVRTVAVLDDATLALAQNDDYVKSASSLLLESAKELMENLQKAGITPRNYPYGFSLFGYGYDTLRHSANLTLNFRRFFCVFVNEPCLIKHFV